MTVILLNAGPDTYGNSRRVFVVLNASNEVIEAIDYGPAGNGSLTRRYPNANTSNIPTFATTPAEYRSLLKNFAKKG